jgi:hypothetical protein
VFFRPLDDPLGDLNRFSILLFGNRPRNARIASDQSISREFLSFTDYLWNRLSRFLKEQQETTQVMHVRKLNVALDHDGLNGLLSSLLGIETQILQVHAREF